MYIQIHTYTHKERELIVKNIYIETDVKENKPS
jgi:hypothetical protein